MIPRSCISLLQALLVLSLAGCRTAPDPQMATAEDSALVLRGATVIDGTGTPPQPNRSILIREGRIVQVQAASEPAPPGARELDLSGHFVIPGLIDSHVHLTYPFETPAEQDSILALLFQGGVTAVRDMAGDVIALSARARAAEDATLPSPRIRYSALMAGPSFMSADDRLAPVAHGLRPGEAPWLRSIAGDTDVLRAVEVAKWTGATGLKLYADLPPEVVQRITAEAHRQGLKVWAHAAVVPARPLDAVEAGVDVLSHADMLVLQGVPAMPGTAARFRALQDFTGIPVASEPITRLLEAMRERGTILEPALYQIDYAGTRVESDTTRRHLWPMREWSFALVRRAHEMGVTIAAGTDLMGWPRTDSLPYLHAELELLVTRAGLTPLEALRAGTLHNARVLGLERDHGSITPGKLADLVILAADPAADIRNTRTVRYIVKAGRVHPRSWPGGIAALSARSSVPPRNDSPPELSDEPLRPP